MLSRWSYWLQCMRLAVMPQGGSDHVYLEILFKDVDNDKEVSIMI